MTYKPKPINTDHITLPEDVEKLTEELAKNTHDLWAEERMRNGWTYGPKRDDEKLEHPSLIEYERLSDSEKRYDRITAMNTLKAIMALGYTIDKKN
ncbi:Ryanodine receptor Ryr [Bacillus sp. H-16]|uniref:RyR domain-containing protein n=1 Tax=Alteribacter salitolerans TaxID=2912333 RepID=UPI0019666964|nr:RyR domain-containing protein [Alteribacter salitolerans]MBM7095299.1 Ryanodine receptor Ryr [Alteribacter salitolerans]